MAWATQGRAGVAGRDAGRLDARLLRGVVLGLGLKYPRYFMPTTLLFLPLVALGLVLAVQAIWRRVPRALGRPQTAA